MEMVHHFVAENWMNLSKPSIFNGCLIKFGDLKLLWFLILLLTYRHRARVRRSLKKSKQVIWYWFMIWFGTSHFQITQIEVEIYLLGIYTILVRPTHRQIKNLSIVENVLFEHVTWLNVACHVLNIKNNSITLCRFQFLLDYLNCVWNHIYYLLLKFSKIILGTSKWDETCWLQYPEGRKFMTFTTESWFDN